MSETRWITINCTDGTDISFRFPDQEITNLLVQRAFEGVLGPQIRLLEGEAVVNMFPDSNIRNIKVQPSTESLPEGSIQDVQLLK